MIISLKVKFGLLGLIIRLKAFLTVAVNEEIILLSDNTSCYVIILSDKEKGSLPISLTKSIRETIKE